LTPSNQIPATASKNVTFGVQARQNVQDSSSGIPLRQFGRADAKVSILGLAGITWATHPIKKLRFALFRKPSTTELLFMVRYGGVTAQQGLRHAVSLPVATTISGIDSMEVLDQNLAVATNFQPFTAAELKELRDQCRQFAGDGQYELFKMTTKYDGKIGREQHHFRKSEELPL
jgi:hypothetical protein